MAKSGFDCPNCGRSLSVDEEKCSRCGLQNTSTLIIARLAASVDTAEQVGKALSSLAGLAPPSQNDTDIPRTRSNVGPSSSSHHQPRNRILDRFIGRKPV